MKVIVIIAFRGNEQLLRWVVEGFVRQQLPPGLEMEVRIGGDGCAPPAMAGTGSISVLPMSFERIGAAAVRNRLLQELPGQPEDVVIFANADARPKPNMVQGHLARLATLSPGEMVIGSAPWELSSQTNSSVWECLLAHTPMIFFYGQMRSGERYDFRSCWTLNLSMHLETFRKAGGFQEHLRPVYYEDLSLGFHAMGPEHKGVFFDESIRVVHRHPMTIDQYLDREELLGLMAPVVARYEPAMFAKLFAATSAQQLADLYRPWVQMDLSMHRWVYERLASWASLPAESLGTPPMRSQMLTTIYQMHVPLKRLAFRLGFLRGMELADDVHWKDRQPASLWKSAVAT